MKLEYKILWFDDQPHNVDSAKDGLQTRLARIGFKLNIEWVEKIGNIGSLMTKLARNFNYDLILVDWDLGNDSIKGDELAKHLRKNFKTDIIFYSSESPKNLRKLIFDKGVDGVFCIRRDNLTPETMSIIDYSVKKIIDLNHMRGIVMSTVSDFDKIIDESLKNRYNQFPLPEKNTFSEKIIKKMLDVCESNIKQIKKIDNNEGNIDELLNHRAFSSSLKQQILMKVLENKKDDQTISLLLDTLKRYTDDVINPRNKLAHATPEINPDGRSILIIDGKEYSNEDFCTLRVNLLCHSDNLMDILQAINSGVLIDE
ncbi:response regulator [Pectobacterium zantedeschiae]|uniref:response regulator n=1 Tax=Pectobacterium zantedeschiae TaxID=2034769 RepID=UPI00101CB994|nr:response regulator [Pectobacterium zantedeschiae]RYC43095.1 hypothetical protein DEH81_11215 [Pectobacterium zantedeschiae]